MNFLRNSLLFLLLIATPALSQWGESGGTLDSTGAVTSFGETGDTAQTGTIKVAQGSNVTITRSGKVFTFAASLSGSGVWTNFTGFVRPDDDGDGIHLLDVAANDSVIIAIDGSGNVTFTTTTGNIIWVTGNTGDAAFQVPSGSISTAEILNATILTEDIDANAAIAQTQMANMTDERMLGNDSGGATTPQEMTAANVLTFLGVETGATADQTDEEIQDAAFTSTLAGTETRITVTYNDGGNVIDFVVDDMLDGDLAWSDTTAIGDVGIFTLFDAITGYQPLDAELTSLAGLSVATGDLVQASAANTYARLAAVATGNALISGGVGVVSSWGKIGLTTHISGILPGANGGTNNGFMDFTGPASTLKTFTLPNSSETLAYAGGAFHDGFSDFVAAEHVAPGAGISATGDLDWSGTELTEGTTWDASDRLAFFDNTASGMRYITHANWLTQMAAETQTWTNKTFDANGTGNSISNLEDADHANDALDPDKLVGDDADNNLIDYEIGGLEADVSAFAGFPAINAGATVARSIVGSGRISVSNGNGASGNPTISMADTGEVQLPAALWDTTSTTNGTLDFLETGAYRIKYWEYAASTQDTLLMTCDVNFTIPQDFGSWIDVKFEYENESTGADTLIMRMEGIAHDEAHAADLVIGSAADTLVSATGPAANDLRQGTAQTSITGTFAPEDHVHLILYRPATDAGVMRFLKLTFRYLKS